MKVLPDLCPGTVHEYAESAGEYSMPTMYVHTVGTVIKLHKCIRPNGILGLSRYADDLYIQLKCGEIRRRNIARDML